LRVEVCGPHLLPGKRQENARKFEVIKLCGEHRARLRLRGLGGDGFMADVVVRGNGVAAQQRDAELDQTRAVGLHIVGNGADQGAFAGAHLVQGLGNAILADDGEVDFAAGLAGGVEDAERAGVGCRGDQDALAFAAAAEQFGNGQLARLPHAAAFERDEPISRGSP
jgi:hypothetical protein